MLTFAYEADNPKNRGCRLGISERILGSDEELPADSSGLTP